MVLRSHARSIIALGCPPARRTPATNTGFAPSPLLYLSPLLRTIGLAVAIAGFVLAAATWETRAALVDRETGPDATVSTTPVEVYEMAKCSVGLMAMVEFETVPVTLLAVKTVKVCHTVGVKPLTSTSVSVPPRLAAPDTCR